LSKTTRREFLKIGMAAAGSALAASMVEIPLFTGPYSSFQTQLNNANSQLNSLKSKVDTLTGFLSLSVTEQALLESVVETIIPSDSTGPGAKEAGVIYFIDRQLSAGYGSNSRMYAEGPFLLPNQSGPITVGATSYPGGTPPFAYDAGFGYQYHMTLKEFWRAGLQSLEAYSKSAYGGDYETLSSDNQIKVLQDLSANKPTNFTAPSASDFFKELVYMVWAGFLSDPIYGGNRGMVGWELIGFNGLNQGGYYGEGLDIKQLMVATTPTRLKPVSIGVLQQEGV